jgi:hypothetical protein
MRQAHPKYTAMGLSTLVLGLLVFTFSCKKGEELPNASPDTKLSIESINLTGDKRLNSTVNLTWFGTDIDGYVKHYEIKINEGEWFPTNLQDSTFLFNIDPDADSTDIDFYVRAVDNENLPDPTPAYIRVPLKNTPPIVTFDRASLTEDTTNLVITFRYLATDPDGNTTLKKAFIRANEGTWTEIDLKNKLISLIPANPKTTGIGAAKLYYGLDKTAALTIDGFKNGAENLIQLKVTDIANSESKVDSSTLIYTIPQTSDLLIVGGHNASISAEYEKLVKDNYINYDKVDYAKAGGKYQPKFWDPSFRLLAMQYDKLFFHTEEGTTSNPFTGIDGKLLDFAAPVIQTLIDNKKKVLISTSFSNGADLSILSDVLSIDSFSSAKGQAFFTNDSSAVSKDATYPALGPANFLLSSDPFYSGVEAEIFYTAQLTPSGGWTGPRCIAIRRRNNSNQVNLVLFSVELHKLNRMPTNQNQLLSKILNEAFNW